MRHHTRINYIRKYPGGAVYRWFAECSCRWMSHLHQSKDAAKEAAKEHITSISPKKGE